MFESASVGVESAEIGRRARRIRRRRGLSLDVVAGVAGISAQAQGARDGEAIGYLNAADRLAPQYVRPDPMARELVAELHRRARRRIWELDSLRNRFGIGEPDTRRMQK